MRIENKEAVEYLLRRGINPEFYDNSGKNAIHFVVEFQNLEMLTFLCEGKWISTLKDNDEIIPNSKDIPPWVYASWQALDITTNIEGFLPIHFAAFVGNKKIIQYILAVVQLRNNIKNNEAEKLEIKEMLEYKTKSGLTPLLVAAQCNKLEAFTYLLHRGADVYAISSKMQNALHYAVINKNRQMLNEITQIDCEKCVLLNQFDYKGKNPKAYDKNNEFKILLISIWEAIRELKLTDILTVVAYYKEKLNQNLLEVKTKEEGNTPLHYAVLHNKFDAIKLLVELGSDANHPNFKSVTPYQLAESIHDSVKKKRTQQALLPLATPRGTGNFKFLKLSSRVVIMDSQDQYPAVHYGTKLV